MRAKKNINYCLIAGNKLYESKSRLEDKLNIKFYVASPGSKLELCEDRINAGTNVVRNSKFRPSASLPFLLYNYGMSTL